jgi:hypothetical protein
MSEIRGVSSISALRNYGPDERFMGVNYMLNTKPLGEGLPGRGFVV